MKKYFKLFVLLFVTSTLFNSLYAQRLDLLSRMVGSGKPIFDLEVVKLFSKTSDSLKLGCFLNITNNNLHFKKKSDLDFFASYKVNIAIFENGEDFPLIQKNYKYSVKTNKYEDTEKSTINNDHNYYFILPEGDFKIIVKVEDKITNTFFKQEQNVLFHKEGAKLGVTRPIIVSADDKYFDANKLKPQSGNIVNSKLNSVGLFFQVLTEEFPQSYEINYIIIDRNNKEISSSTFHRRSNTKISNELIKFKVKDIDVGKYQVDILVKIGTKKFVRRVDFFVRWKSYSLNISNVSNAIRQMIYLESADTLEVVLKTSLDKQKKWFTKYWKITGEDLTTGENTLLNEYYRRISYSITHFTTPQKDGWKSDRGQVYCMMGSPDEIRNFALPKGLKPYMVWIYYEREIQYVFDYIGGDFKLRK